ncbi:MAG TPA: hypothetical protein DIU35_14990 [Candidatus Latescibacteria bacterium]|nr:hypothetical protein [Gemmatimonadota bacterium]HCR18784.1 hypothetical protein [Candidatus Latescibacterota bacterium]|tara:strand:- start:1688 stop:2161 length:474 start_codon:yes stop_codon:yes gene_type:complete
MEQVLVDLMANNPACIRYIERKDTESRSVWYGGGYLENIDQLRVRLEPDYKPQLAEIRRKREESARVDGACWMIIPWCFHTIATSMSLEPFVCACYDRPDFIQEAMNWVESRNHHAVQEVVSRVQPDLVLIDDDCAYKTGTMISPEMMTDFTLEPSS